MARRLNLDGDGQADLAGHGGEQRAVMVYQLASYRYWEAHLQRHDLECGQFGENLTVDGLADDQVCIGDCYRIGTAVFEVTQPRVTCYRVGIRMNNPEMPSLLVSHKRPGFYCRVIEEGEVGAGDEIVKVADGPERLTVAETDALLYLPGHAPDQLRRALRIPSLSEGWKSSFTALLAAGDQGGNVGLAPTAPAPAWGGFKLLRVVGVQRESEGVLSFRLAAEDHSPLPTPLAGEFLVFKIEAAESAVPLLRSYSMSGPPDGQTYRVSVKRGSGQGSRYFHDRLHLGDLIQASAPRGSFTLVPSEQPVVLLSAGIGATPVLSMLHELKSAGTSSEREVWWCYGARNGREHPFAAEVRDVLKSLRRSHSLVVYSNPEAQDRLGEDYDAIGRLSLSLLQGRKIPQTADYYLCGPATFLAELSKALEGWNVPQNRIHAEAFGSGSSLTPGIADAPTRPAHAPSGAAGSGPTVSFTRTGLSVPWDARFRSLLELAEACDVPARWSCRVGVCHTCQTGVIAGSVSYEPKPLEQPSGSEILICCATPLSEIALDL
jgi:ferredoxin-NADP reductase/MOSC domain-containing protein YiiM/ferredoxin